MILFSEDSLAATCGSDNTTNVMIQHHTLMERYTQDREAGTIQQ